MAVLSILDRARVWAHVLRVVGWPGLVKAEISAALAATDDWIEANQVSFNTGLPQPFRSTANVTQKTLLFCYVAMRRAGMLRTEEE